MKKVIAVNAKDVSVTDWEARLQVEGDPYYLSANTGSTGVAVATGNVNTSITSMGTPPRIGKMAWLDSVNFGTDSAGIFQFWAQPDTNNRFSGITLQFYLAANGFVTMPIRQIVRPHQFANQGIGVNVRNNLTAGSVTYKAGVGISARVLTDDLNYTAEHTLMFAGDSTLNGTGPTKTATMWPFKVRDWLIGQGYDCRVLLKSASGSTSSDHEGWRADGWHGSSLNRYSAGFYNLGINDAVSSVASATVLANAQAFWNWWSAKYPRAPLVIVGPTPLENNTYEANAAGYRTAISAWVASVGSSKLKFVDTTALWDRTVSANYATSDTAGNRIHYVDSAHALVADAVTAAISTGAYPVAP